MMLDKSYRIKIYIAYVHKYISWFTNIALIYTIHAKPYNKVQNNGHKRDRKKKWRNGNQTEVEERSRPRVFESSIALVVLARNCNKRGSSIVTQKYEREASMKGRAVKKKLRGECVRDDSKSSHIRLPAF